MNDIREKMNLSWVPSKDHLNTRDYAGFRCSPGNKTEDNGVSSGIADKNVEVSRLGIINTLRQSEGFCSRNKYFGVTQRSDKATYPDHIYSPGYAVRGANSFPCL